MTHSLEVRSPLLDHVFMELAATPPRWYKAKGRRTKIGLKDARATLGADHVLRRPKQGLLRATRGDGCGVGCGPCRRRCCSTSRRSSADCFEPSVVRRLIDEHLSRRADHARQLWALVQLELWFRTYIDQEVLQPPTLSIG
jgi:asparagine synthase (glutamine-hydrolysing)